MNPFEGVQGHLVAFATVAHPPEFPAAFVERRDRSDEDLRAHLEGLQGWIWSHVEGGMPGTAVCHAMEHCWRTHHQVVFDVVPEVAGEIIAWAEAANAVFFFPDATLRNPQGEVLVGENPADGADVPYPKESLARKARNEAALQDLGVQCAPHLPPSAGESEVILRPPEDVLARARALIFVALRASSLAEKQPIPLAALEAKFPGGLFTEYESSFLEAENVPEEAFPQFSWRYEALVVLVWALGLIPDLVAPSELCDTGQLINVMTGDLPETSALRPISEILDALDCHYRMHWWVRTCAGAGDETPFIQGVLHERRTALSWLIRFGELDWENIPLPT